MMKIFWEKILTAFRRKLFCEKLCCRCLTKLSIFHISICHIFLKKPIILIEKPVILIEKPIILIEKPIISMCNSHFDKKISFSNWKPTFTFPIAKKQQQVFNRKTCFFDQGFENYMFLMPVLLSQRLGYLSAQSLVCVFVAAVACGILGSSSAFRVKGLISLASLYKFY